MADKSFGRKLIDFIALPVLTGIVVAAAVLSLFPELRTLSDNLENLGDIGAEPLVTTPSDPVSYSQAVKRAAPSVVNIYTRTLPRQNNHPLLSHPLFARLYKQQQQRGQDSLGSGVIMDAQGFIVTSYHVVGNVDKILVLLYDGRVVPASIVGTDPETDLAVLKIDSEKLQGITLGNPDQIQIGDVVLAIGNPFGMGQTVTQVIVSATRRNGLNLNTFENYIQTDADINPGNSGGALIDAYGNLLGINSAKINRNDSEGIGFAIPVDEVQKVLSDIVQYGRVIRGWLGFEASQLTPTLSRHLNINTPRGLLITGIANGAPAESAGIMIGDIVVSINGIPVTNAQKSINQIAGIVPGQPIELQLQRGSKLVEVTATAGSRPLLN
jgi:serine protease DegS